MRLVRIILPIFLSVSGCSAYVATQAPFADSLKVGLGVCGLFALVAMGALHNVTPPSFLQPLRLIKWRVLRSRRGEELSTVQ